MNMVVEALGAEEPEITSVAVRPGVVDTNMQVEIRSVHQEAMGEKVGGIFKELHATGKLLKPEQPGHVIAKLAVSAGKELSGKFVSWDGEEVAAFQE
jgi:NAD(P)-dependent dehydrogenase (short-subunit alcohol dehydrogenase family)